MGTGFSMDPNEYRSAANVIEGYGAMQADHGSALAAGTSTPLSSSGTGIAGAISRIAQGTVQKIVTDVTSTTQGFADDTAKGLRLQADNMERLETDLAGRTNSILGDAQSAVLSGVHISGVNLIGSSTSGGDMSGMPTMVSGPMTADALSGTSTMVSRPTTGDAPLNEYGVSGTGAAEQEASQASAAQSSAEMHGGTGRARLGAADERGQRPGYLKSKMEVSGDDEDRTKAAIDRHLQECGAAPIPFGSSRLVCAKCGSILEIDDAAVSR